MKLSPSLNVEDGTDCGQIAPALLLEGPTGIVVSCDAVEPQTADDPPRTAFTWVYLVC